MKFRYLNFLTILLLLLAIPAIAQDTTTLGWDYMYEEDLGVDGGFNIYMSGAPGALGSIIATTGPSERQATVDASNFCGEKFYTATAFIEMPDLESDKSNEVSEKYAPNAPTSLIFTDPGVFTWSLSHGEDNCLQLHYKVYLSKQQGFYNESNLVAVTDKGTNFANVDVSGYRGKWYSVVVAVTQAYDGSDIPSGISNEIALGFKPNKPTTLTILD